VAHNGVVISRLRDGATGVLLVLLAVAGPALLGWSGAPVQVTAVMVTVTALAAAGLALRIAALRTPALARAESAAWPGHPRRRAGGDLPRQLHPDSPGRSRPRAPGGR
jgi:hypothetical protein